MSPSPRKPTNGPMAFTLVELMVSTSIIALLLLMVAGMVDQFTRTWKGARGKIGTFQAARDGFEAMARKISQATLNTFWDLYYVNIGGRQAPTDFVRQSQLRFLSGPMAKLAPDNSRLTHGIFFQAPLGVVEDGATLGAMDNLLNTWGYFIEEADDTQTRPAFLADRVPVRRRPRLMELMQPAEAMSVYDLDPKGQTSPVPGDQLRWFKPALSGSARPVRVIAENVVALILRPKLAKREENIRRDQGKSPLAPNYVYDSSLLTFKSKRYGSAVAPIYLNEGAQVVTASDPSDAAQINPKNQLPPIVQVTMVAVDEDSAAKLEEKSGGHAVRDLSAGLFEVACAVGTRSNEETRFESDLKQMEQRLVAARVNYRIFTTNVAIRAAKWSAAQTK